MPTIEEKQEAAKAYAALRRQEPWSDPASPEMVHHRVLPFATYSPWLSDSQFQEASQKVQGHTLVDPYRRHELWSLAKQSRKVPGCILEVGVWRGGTGALMAAAAPEKLVHLADTFEGVVKAGERDPGYKGGEHADTSERIVEELLASMGISNARLHRGMFPEDTGGQVEGPVALLHCDVDVYESAKGVVEWCLPRLSSGGVMVFDDYGFHGCEGVARYCSELAGHPGLIFAHNLNGHAIFFKR